VVEERGPLANFMGYRRGLDLWSIRFCIIRDVRASAAMGALHRRSSWGTWRRTVFLLGGSDFVVVAVAA